MERLTRTAFGGPGPSERSRQFLSTTHYRGGDDFAQMIRHCQQQAAGPRRREALHAAAEVSYLAAEHTRSNDRGLALDLYLDAVRYSWNYIALPQSNGRLVDPNTAPHRATAEVYNTSLRKLLRLASDKDDYRLGRPLRLPVSGRILDAEIPYPSEWLSREQLGEFAFVADYELKNLRNRHTTPGVGVPIMVRRRRNQVPTDLEQYYTDGLTLPVTVVARFPEHPGDPNQRIRLQLLDPRKSDGIVVRDTLVPLESDLSTPLAWFLTNPKASLLETFAFLRPDRARKLEGLYMVQPYDPERIPVLMVHGIWSSPMTWMEMFNDLQADPALRDKYQFWFYMYPTGEPLAFATATLRERLKEVRLKCDPYGQNRKLDQMVVVGHSMGGLMAYLMTIDSEDRLWNSLSRLRPHEIQADPEIQNQIRRVFFFEGDRAIDRIVTIASPFRGSGYANSFTRWLGGSLVSLPTQTSRLSELIFRQNNQSVWDRMFAPRTSIDSLNKHSAILSLVSQTTVPDSVQHHNVVGILKGDSPEDWTDSVVRFPSAHRTDVKSEVLVEASHSKVHQHSEAIEEVRRVLFEHLKQQNSDGVPVIPLKHSPEGGDRPSHVQLAPLAP